MRKKRLIKKRDDALAKERMAYVRAYADGTLSQKTLDRLLGKSFLPNNRIHSNASSKTVQRIYRRIHQEIAGRNGLKLSVKYFKEVDENGDESNLASIQVRLFIVHICMHI